MSRTESREHALQILFQMEMKEHDITPEAAASFIIEPPAKDEFAETIVLGVKENETSLDELIKPHLKQWSLDRLNKADRIILRIAVYELYHSDAPDKVVVNEAVNLAKKFSDDDAYKFVNGVLSEIIKNKA